MLNIILMHSSNFFFANDLLLAVYFIFILDYRNDVRHKVNSSVFLFKFKTGRKAVETTCNISNIFCLGTANEHTVQWWFKKLYKGDKNLEDEEHSGWPSEADSDQSRAIVKADPLITT